MESLVGNLRSERDANPGRTRFEVAIAAADTGANQTDRSQMEKNPPARAIPDNSA